MNLKQTTMRMKPVVILGLVVLAVTCIVTWAALSPFQHTSTPASHPASQDFKAVVQRVDEFFASRWQAAELTPAQPADELKILRRLSLTLHGTIPSLEEVREFEADDRPDRLSRWVARMLDDNRFADYFAERLARSFVGVEGGAFIIFRRGRFVGWLSEQLKQNTPYDQVVREMVSGTGLWTGKPATNFITAAFANDELDENKLAGRAVRAFLGQRIDCAQCHDHPFDEWSQAQFAGLAAHFAQTQLSAVGVEDKSSFLFKIPNQWSSELDAGRVSKDLRSQFSENDAGLRKDDVVEVAAANKIWLIRHTIHDMATQYVIRLEDGQLNVCDDQGENSPSILFQLSNQWQKELDKGEIPEDFREEFSKNDEPIHRYDKIKVETAGRVWHVQRPVDDVKPRYMIRREDDVLAVYDYEGEFKVQDRDTLEDQVFAPAVPFHPEWLPKQGTRRERLGGWITHPKNRRFERAIANRVWGLIFGRSFLTPVDDLPDPDDPEYPEAVLLDFLGQDFREHGYDLRRLIHVIAASKPFRIASAHSSSDPEQIEALQREWAVFPLTRLRPEQVVGSMLQASSIRTIDQNSHLIFRTTKFFRTANFIEEYGDLGEDELDEHSGTIPQALLRMNGELPKAMSDAGPFSSPGRVANMSSTDALCLENCYLVCLSRRPTEMESEHFLALLRGVDGEKQLTLVGDIFWTLYNSPEFSWNH